MNNKVLLDTAFQSGNSVVNGTKVYTKSQLVVYDGKKYAVNPKAMFTINVTAKCNAYCFFCYNSITFMRDNDFVSCDSEEFKRAVKFAKSAGIETATITGGEPTLNPKELLKLIHSLKTAGFSTIRLHTNGYFLSRAISIDGETLPLWKWLEQYGVKEMSISIADYRAENNLNIMGIDNLAKVKNFLIHVKEIRMRIRLSCFLCKQGIHRLEDIVEYLHFAKMYNVDNIIFRLMPEDDSSDRLYMKSIINKLLESGWQVSYSHRKSDSTIYEFVNENRHISLSYVKEEIDEDQKIRRLIYMPDKVVYTSWIDPSSYLFEDDAKKIINSVNLKEKNKNGTYPGSIWNREIPEYIHRHEAQLIDLHVHSLVSDGLLAPSKVIENASKAGIKKMVFTEHNCLHDSTDALIQLAQKNDIDIPLLGVEFSTVYCIQNKPWMKFHLLVYGNRKEQFAFMNDIYDPNEPRNLYLIKVYQELKQKNIVCKPLDEIYAIHDDKAPTRKKMLVRSLLANEIASNCGITQEEAKSLYLPQMPDEDRYKRYLNTEDIIRLAHENGCVAVLAHPGWIRPYDKNKSLSEKDLFLAITDLARKGMNGIEIVHRLNDEHMRDKLFRLACELNLIITGGSDYHGKPRCTLCENGTSEDELIKLMEKIY